MEGRKERRSQPNKKQNDLQRHTMPWRIAKINLAWQTARFKKSQLSGKAFERLLLELISNKEDTLAVYV